jgi:hypothetical protein
MPASAAMSAIREREIPSRAKTRSAAFRICCSVRLLRSCLRSVPRRGRWAIVSSNNDQGSCSTVASSRASTDGVASLLSCGAATAAFVVAVFIPYENDVSSNLTSQFGLTQKSIHSVTRAKLGSGLFIIPTNRRKQLTGNPRRSTPWFDRKSAANLDSRGARSRIRWRGKHILLCIGVGRMPVCARS